MTSEKAFNTHSALIHQWAQVVTINTGPGIASAALGRRLPIRRIKPELISAVIFFCLSTGFAVDPLTVALKKLDGSGRFQNGYLASIWGSIQSKLASAVRRDGISFQEISVKTPLFRSGTFKLTISLEGGATPIKAPMVVVLAGLFSDSVGDLPMRYLRALRGRGYHVLVVSNSWSNRYLEQGPQFKPADFPSEARVVLESVASAIVNHVGPQHVDGISLLGESYGGFLSSVVLSLDRGNLFSKGALIVGPPVNMSIAMRRLDTVIAETRGQDYCVDKWSSIGLVKDLLLASSDVAVSENVKRCAKAFFAMKGFQFGLKAAAERLDQIRFLKLSPDEQKNLTFSTFVNTFIFPGGQGKPDPKYFDMGYWLAQARLRNPTLPLRIISAEDDALNDPTQWHVNTHFQFRNANLSLLKWGGHVGFVMSYEFQRVLDEIFGQMRDVEVAPYAVSF
ncbi:MAG: hypothetical protein K2X47_01145 [Bdellovibrionales bacterium]|nr:hypothetical protein [Bdellovibrionales bacterium]